MNISPDKIKPLVLPELRPENEYINLRPYAQLKAAQMEYNKHLRKLIDDNGILAEMRELTSNSD